MRKLYKCVFTVFVDPKRLLERWYKLVDHPTQLALVNDHVRFKVCAAGRRSGKSERAKRHVVKAALSQPNRDFFIAAPTWTHVKKIHWEDCKRLALAPLLPQKPLESELIIRLPNGSNIHLIGLDKPARFEGVNWAGGVIDEIADIKEGAWVYNIKPALDTQDPSRNGELAWCWIIGVPDGVGNTFHELALYAQSGVDPDWRFYSWPSSDLLPPEVIEAAKRSMSAQAYAQEYCASFESATGRIYSDYNDLNVTQETIQPHEQLWWCHDQNFSPMSSCIAVKRGESLFVLDEIILQSATSMQSAMEFTEKFKNHANKHVILYGDASGRAGEKHGHASDYTQIEQHLRPHGWKVERKIKAANPAIRDRQNALRARIANAAGERRLFVNASKCRYVHKGLLTLSVKEGSTFIEEQSEWGHVTCALGYLVDREWPVRPEVRKAEPMISLVHHWPKPGQWGSR